MIEKKLFRFVLLFYLLAFSNALLNGVFQKFYGGAFTSLSYWGVIWYYLFNYGTKFLFILLAIYFTKRKLIDTKASILVSVVVHLIITFLFSLYSSLFILWYQKYNFNNNSLITLESVLQQVTFGSSFNFFIYFSVIALVYAYYYLLRQKEQELNRTRLSAQLLDAKINALQSQLQPHFIFNALNDISSLMDLSIDKAQNAIVDLSEMLRLTLSIKDDKYISINKELSILKKYLDVEKIRFDQKLEIHFDVEDNLLNEFMPPLLLQPIVENSIKHGFSYDNDSIKVAICINGGKESINFEISNSGQLLTEDFNYGIGLTNIISRMNTLYNGEFKFEMFNTTENNVMTSIRIPKRK